MAGICGMVGNINEDSLRAMSQIIRHRGEHEVVFISGSDGVGFIERNQNAIGSKILTDEQSSIYMACDGIFFNYPELRSQLQSKGHKFATGRNEEVACHLYEEYGEGAFELLDGDFALALWDSRSKKLVLARDKFGVRTLYYTASDKGLFFASEIKSLLLASKKEVNPVGVYQYLSYGHSVQPTTLIKDVAALPPSQIFTYEPGRGAGARKRYWRPRLEVREGQPEEFYITNFYEAFKKSVKKRLFGQSIGVTISGGIDSTLVISAIAGLVDKPVKTFCLGGWGAGSSDLRYARIIAEYFGTEHTELTLEPQDYKAIPRMIWQVDSPLIHAAVLPYDKLALRAKDEVDCLFAGEPGDIVMLGDLWLAGDGWRRYVYSPAFLKLQKLFSPFAAVLTPLPRVFGDGKISHYIASAASLRDMRQFLALMIAGFPSPFFEPDLAIKVDRSFKDESVIQFLDFRNPHEFYNQLLWMNLNMFELNAGVPFMSPTWAYYSLLPLFPFLDPEVVEACSQIPPSLKHFRKKAKYVAKRALSGKVPEAIITRPKKGFSVSAFGLFNSELTEIAAQVLSHPLLLIDDRYFSKQPLGVIEQFLKHQGEWEYKDSGLLNTIFRFLTLELWYRTFIQRTDISQPLSF